MSTTVQKWGNSLGIRIPREAANRVNLKASHREYNAKTGLAIVCPMTRQIDKGWPFTVLIDKDSGIIADQVC